MGKSEPGKLRSRAGRAAAAAGTGQRGGRQRL